MAARRTRSAGASFGRGRSPAFAIAVIIRNPAFLSVSLSAFFMRHGPAFSRRVFLRPSFWRERMASGEADNSPFVRSLFATISPLLILPGRAGGGTGPAAIIAAHERKM
jgi:hypothetical protein